MPMNSFSRRAASSFTSFRLGQSAGHSSNGFERHEKFGDERSIRIGGVFAAALLGNDGTHRRITGDHVADLVDRVTAGIERNRRRQQGADPEIAFFELWQKFGAEPHPEAAAHDKEGEGDHRCHARVFHGKGENALVDIADVRTTIRFDLVHLVGQQKRRHHRRDRESRDHRAEQRIGISARHRPENLAFNALHREKRQERCDRNDHREEDRFVDFDGGRQNSVQPVATARVRWMTR